MDTDENGSGSISHLSTSLARRNQIEVQIAHIIFIADVVQIQNITTG